MKLPLSFLELSLSLWRRTRPELPYVLPKAQAHRGLFDSPSAGKPQGRENTLKQLCEARAQGALMAEFDVRLSSDLVPVLYHDESIQLRDGSWKNIGKMDFRELQSFGVSSLAEVIESPGVPDFLNIEIKGIRRALVDLGHYEKPIVQVVRQSLVRSPSKKILFSSFDPSVLGALSLLCPEYPRALIYGSQSEKHSPNPLLALPLTHAQILHIEDVLLMDPRWLELLGRYDVPFAVWTVNDSTRARDLLRVGALSVISDINLSSLL